MHFEAHGLAEGKIISGGSVIAEIRKMALCNACFGEDRAPLIGCSVPLLLYWRQYHRHEDPERNTGSHAQIRCLSAGEEEVVLSATGFNRSKTVRSECILTVERDKSDNSISYSVDTALEVRRDSWEVTRHEEHGDLEFLNILPEGAFAAAGERKKYSDCVLRRGERTLRIPHHHFESSDKRNIILSPGDMFLYALEDENLALQLLSPEEAEAGVCAYMWDAHIGLRVCRRDRSMQLMPGTSFRAACRVFAMSRSEAEALLACAEAHFDAEIDDTPLYTGGLHRFSESARDAAERGDGWPWIFSADSDARGYIDRSEGYDDAYSLAMEHGSSTASKWVATTIGPAFGEAPFHDGCRLKLNAMILTRDFTGYARLHVRLHREGAPFLFDPGLYETFTAEQPSDAADTWTSLTLVTASISPAPDRAHIVLEAVGIGVCRFDNVLLQRLPPGGPQGESADV